MGNLEDELEEWTNIIEVGLPTYLMVEGHLPHKEQHVVGLKEDGTVVAEGDVTDGQCDVTGWTDVKKIFVAPHFTMGLTNAGTLLCTGTHEASHAVLQSLQQVRFVILSFPFGENCMFEIPNIIFFENGDIKTVGTDGSIADVFSIGHAKNVVDLKEILFSVAKKVIIEHPEMGKLDITAELGGHPIVAALVKEIHIPFSVEGSVFITEDNSLLSLSGQPLPSTRAADKPILQNVFDGTIGLNPEGVPHENIAGTISSEIQRVLRGVATWRDGPIFVRKDGTLHNFIEEEVPDTSVEQGLATSSWTGLKAVTASMETIYGLKDDGTVLSTKTGSVTDNWDSVRELRTSKVTASMNPPAPPEPQEVNHSSITPRVTLALASTDDPSGDRAVEITNFDSRFNYTFEQVDNCSTPTLSGSIIKTTVSTVYGTATFTCRVSRYINGSNRSSSDSVEFPATKEYSTPLVPTFEVLSREGLADHERRVRITNYFDQESPHEVKYYFYDQVNNDFNSPWPVISETGEFVFKMKIPEQAAGFKMKVGVGASGSRKYSEKSSYCIVEPFIMATPQWEITSAFEEVEYVDGKRLTRGRMYLKRIDYPWVGRQAFAGFVNCDNMQYERANFYRANLMDSTKSFSFLCNITAEDPFTGIEVITSDRMEFPPYDF